MESSRPDLYSDVMFGLQTMFHGDRGSRIKGNRNLNSTNHTARNPAVAGHNLNGAFSLAVGPRARCVIAPDRFRSCVRVFPASVMHRLGLEDGDVLKAENNAV